MQLLASWKDSLKIFYPLDNLKLFCLAVLRALQVAVPQFFKTFWWFIGLYLVNDYFNLPLKVLLLPLGLAFLFGTVRPSVGLKGIDYWKQQYRHVLVSFLGAFFIFGGSLVLVYGGQQLLDEASFSHSFNILEILLLVILALLIDVFFILLPVWSFFFFDSHATLHDVFLSIRRAATMIFFNFPTWLILFVMVIAGYWLFDNFFVAVPAALLDPVFEWVLLGIFACVWSVFYTMRLHKQPELYFSAPQVKE